MCAAKKKTNGFLYFLLAHTFRKKDGSTWFTITTILLLFALAYGTYHMWMRYGDQIVGEPDYWVTPDNIRVTEQPPWIRSDVKAEAAVNGSLAKVNLLEHDLTVRVAQAFEMHPWVRDVKQAIKRFPSEVLVELEYRQPVAMVEVAERKVFPIDIDGTLLPPKDFTPKDAQQYPLIAITGSYPARDIAGNAWGDTRITDAARIAAIFQDTWHELGLYRITTDDIDSRPRAPIEYRLDLMNGDSYVWGSAPGKERAGEDSPRDKLARLTEYVSQRGPVLQTDDGEPVSQTMAGERIDLRHAQRPKIQAR